MYVCIYVSENLYIIYLYIHVTSHFVFLDESYVPIHCSLCKTRVIALLTLVLFIYDQFIHLSLTFRTI